MSSGLYSFDIYRDDGARLWIDGELAFNEWTHTSGYNSFQTYLSGGTHVFQFEMFEMTGGAAAHLTWISTEMPYQLFLPSISTR